MSSSRTGLSRRNFLIGTSVTAATAALPAVLTPDAEAAVLTQSTLMVQDTDPAVVYQGSWTKFAGLNATTWYGGHASSSRAVGATFEYVNEECTQLRWRATKGPDRGIARVYVDGQKVATVDTYAPSLTASAVLFDSGVLLPGKHVLTVEVTGKKNSASITNWIECNAIETVAVSGTTFEVDDTDRTVCLDAAWALLYSPGSLNNAVRTTTTAGAKAVYAHPHCSRLTVFAGTGPDRGQADVFVDGVAAGTIDQYSSARSAGSVALFDSGPLTPGPHSISIVTRGAKQDASTGLRVDFDYVLVEGRGTELDRVVATAPIVVREEHSATASAPVTWQVINAIGAVGGAALMTVDSGNALEFAFTGDTVAVIGSKRPDGAMVEIWLDGVIDTTVDTYAAQTQWGQQLYAKTGLAPNNTHRVRVVSTGSRNGVTGMATVIEAFDCTKAVDVVAAIAAQAGTEMAQIKAGTKSFIPRSSWAPVAYQASAPRDGVRLTGSGPLATGFTNNLGYLNWSYAQPGYVSADTFWSQNWPGANEGRMLAGAGHSMRFLDPTSSQYAPMKAIVDALVQKAKTRQAAAGNGYAMPYAESTITPPVASTANDGERPNYDRAMWTRGMVAAILAGNADAGAVLRGHYDWFNNWGVANLGWLIQDSLGIQGHIGSTLTYFSGVGKPDDIEVADRFYTQEWFLEQLHQREPAAIYRYPLNRAHSYLIIGLEAYVDHYRATGDQKYLEGALGGWDIFSRYFTFAGNGTSICELFQYPPNSEILNGYSNEGCGSVFWVDLNHRLHQLYPDQEKYVAEIERYLFNNCLANQSLTTPFGVRYHAHYEGRKEGPQTISTCDEVTMTGLYGRLPQYVYSVAADGGLYINLYESSSITWGGATLTTTATFPDSAAVSHVLSLAGSRSMKVRVRVPGWATSSMAIKVNGTTVATGSPGTYVTLDRTWSNGDTISYTLPIGFTTRRYTGITQFNGLQRYTLQYGPVLMSLTGTWPNTYVQQSDNSWVPRLTIAPANLPSALTPVAGQRLQWQVAGTQYVYKPYWLVAGEALSCFPIVTP